MEYNRPKLQRIGQSFRKRREDEEERPPKHRGLKTEAEESNNTLQAMVNVIRTLRAMGVIDDMIWRILESGVSKDKDLIRQAFRIASM